MTGLQMASKALITDMKVRAVSERVAFSVITVLIFAVAKSEHRHCCRHQLLNIDVNMSSSRAETSTRTTDEILGCMVLS
jgi:hypothetical protein